MFTKNWHDTAAPFWSMYLGHLKDKPLTYLEIGCYEGKSLHWMFQNILTSSQSYATVVDTFDGSDEHKEEDKRNLYKRFSENIKDYSHRVKIIVGKSQEELRSIDRKFDIIYIDGSHKTSDVLEDAVLSWRLLKKDGIMIFDDYTWHFFKDELQNPVIGIDCFLKAFAGQYNEIFKAHQVIIRKVV